MNTFQRISVFLFSLTILSSCTFTSNGQKGNNPMRIAFYNVENLFDTEDDPLTLDEDFTPSGKQKWTDERYRTKLQRIDQVVTGMEYPVLLGLCEVENQVVLNDLCKTTSLAKNKYQFVHFDSPDRRGIDVALLYQKKLFKVINAEKIHVDFPDEIVPNMPGYTSRDILVVEGYLPKKQKVHVIVAHFPSRRGGVKESEPKRTHVAKHVRDKVDEIFANDPSANIIFMGDLNDETTNKSVAVTLQAHSPIDKPSSKALYNCFAELDATGAGSYNYRGNWNMLDQVILSGGFFLSDSPFKFHSATIYKEDYLMYKDKKNGLRPNRTYGGPNYYGGYSDHLPVFIEVGGGK